MDLTTDDIQEVRFWSRIPGRFLMPDTGEEIGTPPLGGSTFTGTVREWYETLIETIRDVGYSLGGEGCQMDVFATREALLLIETAVLYRPTFKVGGRTCVVENEILSEIVAPGSSGILSEMTFFESESEGKPRVIIRTGEGTDVKYGEVIVIDYDLGN